MAYADSQKNLKLFMSLTDAASNLAEFQRVQVHRDVVKALQTLAGGAAEAGFDFAVASGFRSVERQCQIWNAKARGSRPVLDDTGIPLDVMNLDPEILVFAILRWSALPGASRHHWGTDVDVYDRSALPSGQSLQLTLAECHGPFAPFHQWLDVELARPETPFFRPYMSPAGGVAPEPWHLSFAPCAAKYQRSLGKDELFELVLTLDIALKDEVIRHFDEIFERFVLVSPDLYPLNWPL
jgi:LAS superfamily LD-carboxypeptidase LdcB